MISKYPFWQPFLILLGSIGYKVFFIKINILFVYMADITTSISKWNIVLDGSKTYMNPLVLKRIIKISFFANIFSCIYQIHFPTCKTLAITSPHVQAFWISPSLLKCGESSKWKLSLKT